VFGPRLRARATRKIRFFTDLRGDQRKAADGRRCYVEVVETSARRRAAMAAAQCIERLGAWEGYELEDSWEEHRGGVLWSILKLQPLPACARRCSGCGFCGAPVHDQEERRVRDLPIFEARVELVVPRLRLLCPHCGPKLEELTWLEPYARVTKRLAASVARLCKVMPVRHVSAFYGLSWTTVKLIDLRHLVRELGPPRLDGVEVIGMDEFAIQKGHRYATVIVEPYRKAVLWVCRGRGRLDVRPFFEELGPRRLQVKAAVMDMDAAYAQEVRFQCPNAQIVYDLFHVIAKYGREVIDRVRVEEANRLRQDNPARKLVKSSRWLLLRNRDNLGDRERVRLKELLAANRVLTTVYLMKDELKALWHYRHVGYARRFWDGWYHRAMRSRIEPLKRFAKNLKLLLYGILAHCRFALGTNLIEGINNKIKVIKRMAYGFRDDAYFFLKIRAAFPGIR
jgi:transposase